MLFALPVLDGKAVTSFIFVSHLPELIWANIQCSGESTSPLKAGLRLASPAWTCESLDSRVLINLGNGFWGHFSPRSTETRHIFLIGQSYTILLYANP